MLDPQGLFTPTSEQAPAAAARRERLRLARIDGLALWLLAFIVAWLLLGWSIGRSPPVDNAEQLSWVRSLEWGYYKHPPLPTVLLWPFVRWLGIGEWASYVAAGLLFASALLLARRLVAELCGNAFADLALLGTLCIGYYSHRLNYYNHDVVLLLAVTACAWTTWLAFARRSLRAWAALGVCLGLGALAKYQVALAAATVFVWWVLQQGWRDTLHRRGLLLAAAVALLIFSPHLAWAVSHDFPTVRYALRNSLGTPMTLAQCSVGLLDWTGGQLVMFAGPLLLGTGLWLWTRRRGTRAETAAMPAPLPGARAYLLCWGLLPLAMMLALGLLFHGKLQRNWGTAFMPFTCAALMLGAGRQVWARLRWREALLGFALVQATLIASEVAAMTAPAPVFSQHRWYRFASQQAADLIGPQARQILGGRIRVIAGPQKLASVLSLRLPERPLVLVDGSYEYSPWLPQDMSTMCGILWVGGPREDTPHDAIRHEVGDGLWWAVQFVANDISDCK